MPFPLRAHFAAVGARCRAKKIKDGPQARRLLALAFAPGGRRRPRSAGGRVDGAPTASRVPRWMLSKPIAREAVDGESTPEFSPVTRVGLDPVKNAFQVRAVDAVGEAVIMRALKRGAVQKEVFRVGAALPGHDGGLFVGPTLGAAIAGARFRSDADPAGAHEALRVEEHERPNGRGDNLRDRYLRKPLVVGARAILRPSDQTSAPHGPAAASSRRKSGSDEFDCAEPGRSLSLARAPPQARSSPSAPRQSSVLPS